MPKAPIAAVALILCCIGASAPAQTPAQEPVLPGPKLNLTIPENVDLQPMPSQVAEKVPQVKSHRFFIADEQIVIVDPKDKKVADIIKLGPD